MLFPLWFTALSKLRLHSHVLAVHLIHPQSIDWIPVHLDSFLHLFWLIKLRRIRKWWGVVNQARTLCDWLMSLNVLNGKKKKKNIHFGNVDMLTHLYWKGEFKIKKQLKGIRNWSRSENTVIRKDRQSLTLIILSKQQILRPP